MRWCIFTTFAVLVYGGPSTFFKASRRLRHGDPLSPLLFIIVTKALHGLLEGAKVVELLRGVEVGKRQPQD